MEQPQSDPKAPRAFHSVTQLHVNMKKHRSEAKYDYAYFKKLHPIPSSRDYWHHVSRFSLNRNTQFWIDKRRSMQRSEKFSRENTYLLVPSLQSIHSWTNNEDPDVRRSMRMALSRNQDSKFLLTQIKINNIMIKKVHKKIRQCDVFTDQIKDILTPYEKILVSLKEGPRRTVTLVKAQIKKFTDQKKLIAKYRAKWCKVRDSNYQYEKKLSEEYESRTKALIWKARRYEQQPHPGNILMPHIAEPF